MYYTVRGCTTKRFIVFRFLYSHVVIWSVWLPARLGYTPLTNESIKTTQFRTYRISSEHVYLYWNLWKICLVVFLNCMYSYVLNKWYAGLWQTLWPIIRWLGNWKYKLQKRVIPFSFIQRNMFKPYQLLPLLAWARNDTLIP